MVERGVGGEGIGEGCFVPSRLAGEVGVQVPATSTGVCSGDHICNTAAWESHDFDGGVIEYSSGIEVEKTLVINQSVS